MRQNGTIPKYECGMRQHLFQYLVKDIRYGNMRL